MRLIPAAMALATLTSFLAAPAHADSGLIDVGGQSSGSWSTHTITFSAPLTRAWVSIQGTEYQYLQMDGYFIGIYGDYFGGCVPGAQCEADSFNHRGYLRRATWTATEISFSTYVPRSYFSCNTAPGWPSNFGQPCGNIFTDGGILLDYEADTAVEFTVTQTAGDAVPEPASWALMIAGFGLTGAVQRTSWRRRYFKRAA